MHALGLTLALPLTPHAGTSVLTCRHTYTVVHHHPVAGTLALVDLHMHTNTLGCMYIHVHTHMSPGVVVTHGGGQTSFLIILTASASLRVGAVFLPPWRELLTEAPPSAGWSPHHATLFQGTASVSGKRHLPHLRASACSPGMLTRATGRHGSTSRKPPTPIPLFSSCFQSIPFASPHLCPCCPSAWDTLLSLPSIWL